MTAGQELLAQGVTAGPVLSLLRWGKGLQDRPTTLPSCFSVLQSLSQSGHKLRAPLGQQALGRWLGVWVWPASWGGKPPPT